MLMDEASTAAGAADAGGDVNAFRELVQRYQASVFGVCYRLLGDSKETEDLTQEAFRFRRLGTFDDGRPFGPWMRRVAANLCLNTLEQRRPPAAELDDEVKAIAGDPPDTPERVRSEQSCRRGRLAAIAASLPGGDRVAALPGHELR
jgi:RNA polymerase sigma factor (sigma-70 family)